MPLLFFLAASLMTAPTGASPRPGVVADAIATRRDRVVEFRLIKEAAEELGFRVWLFGGTAAGFAHYVRWDLAREGGDARYRESFFDYDFTNIYRSTQDADLVVDATPEQAEELEQRIRQKMSFLQGSKEHWEVRLLRRDRTASGGQVKQALLRNPDFLGQNTDSNSTGMIELSDPPPGENVVRDLRDWESSTPFFLQDVTEGRLHYYQSPTHRQTSRYFSGDNPEIFSVIRYLVKAFQYDLKVDGEDLERVQAIIEGFDPERDYPAMSSWAKGWLERYGPNLIRHAVDIEYASKTLENLGLRRKLVSLSDPERLDTLGWWLSREPLPTRPVGAGTGKTAAELGLEVVAHDTRDFLAYESITRDTTLRPNVLISRPGAPGEMAAAGPGFYTRLGRSGARGTGLTVRFRVDPRAREGTDFTVAGDVAVFQNRAALEVIPESLDLSALEYFQLLRDDLADPDDRGVWMKLARRIELRPFAPEEEGPLLALIAQEIERRGEEGGRSRVLEEWFAFSPSKAHPELTDKLLQTVLRAVQETELDEEALLALLHTWFDLPAALEHPEVVRRLLEKGELDGEILEHLLNRPDLVRHPGLVRALLEKPGQDGPVAGLLGQEEEWSAHPELFRTILERGGEDFSLAWALRFPGWKNHPEFVEALVRRVDWPAARMLAEHVLSKPFWAGHPELVLRLVQVARDSRWTRSLSDLLTKPHWRVDPVLRGICGGADPTLECLRSSVGELPPADAEEISRAITRLLPSQENEACR